MQVENAQLKVGPSTDTVEAEWNSELKFQWCMMRRGLAMDRSMQGSQLGHPPTMGELHAQLTEQAGQSRFPTNKIGAIGEG